MTSPIMKRKALGRELRKLRAAADASLDEIAKLLGCSAAKVGHIETGRNSPSKPELMVLMNRFNVQEPDREALEKIRQDASKRGWWSTYRLPNWFAGYVGMETDALRIRNFELELIPGLLQTEEYARAVTSLARHMTEPDEIERKVELRLRRQQRLFDAEFELITVFSEAALRRCVADRNIGSAQLNHLINMAQRPNVTVQVVPFTASLHKSMSGSFHLLDFPPDTWPSTAYQEYAVGGHLVDDREIVSKLGTLFAELQEGALSESDSRNLISEYADGRHG